MSFKEAFTKNKEQLLDYDDNAACYFLGALLLFITTPVLVGLLYQIRLLITCSSVAPKYNPKGLVYRTCKCSLCKTEVARRCRAERRRILRSFTFWLTVLTSVCLLSLLGWLVYNLSQVKEITTFNPYEILGVSAKASDKAIRRAFRTLSLKHHPDRNPNDPSSQAKFVMLSKAYQALTDEAAKKNWERYGNPDGPGAMKVGIGLPSFIVAEENHGAVLAFCSMIVVVLLPLSFFLFYVYGASKRYPNGVLVETVHLFGACLRPTTAAHAAVELLANSAESREQTYLKGDLGRLKASLTKEIPQPSRKMEFSQEPIVERNYLLLLAHIYRKHHLIPEDQLGYLQQLLAVSPAITQTMIEIAIMNSWFDCVKYLVDFRRCLVHASPFGAPFAIQLPHFTADLRPKLLEAGIKTLRDFIRDPEKKRDAVLQEVYGTGQELTDIKAFAVHVPDVQVSVKIETVGESVIACGDLVTVTTTVTREYLSRREAAGPVHAPLFPVAKYENWCFFLASPRTRQLISFSQVSGDGRVAESEMRFPAPMTPGVFILQLVVMCDSYIGLDLIMDIPVKVLSKQEAARDLVYVHPDDLELDQKPTILSQMLGIPPGGGGDEEEEEEENVDTKKVK